MSTSTSSDVDRLCASNYDSNNYDEQYGDYNEEDDNDEDESSSYEQHNTILQQDRLNSLESQIKKLITMKKLLQDQIKNG